MGAFAAACDGTAAAATGLIICGGGGNGCGGGRNKGSGQLRAAGASVDWCVRGCVKLTAAFAAGDRGDSGGRGGRLGNDGAFVCSRRRIPTFSPYCNKPSLCKYILARKRKGTFGYIPLRVADKAIGAAGDFEVTQVPFATGACVSSATCDNTAVGGGCIIVSVCGGGGHGCGGGGDTAGEYHWYARACVFSLPQSDLRRASSPLHFTGTWQKERPLPLRVRVHERVHIMIANEATLAPAVVDYGDNAWLRRLGKGGM